MYFVRRAQSRIDQATLENEKVDGIARAEEGIGSGQVPFLLAERATMKRMGRTPTLVLCSRNARPQKGLVRRPHLDQHGCPSLRGKQAIAPSGVILKDGGRSMRAVKDSPATPLSQKL
jgi:hypothetical protein